MVVVLTVLCYTIIYYVGSFHDSDSDLSASG
jgi:hypothetical protein